MNEYGKRLKERRRQLGMNAEQVAELAGLDPSTVYRYEAGKIAAVTTDKLLPIAKALKTTPGWIMGWEGDDTRGQAESHGIAVRLSPPTPKVGVEIVKPALPKPEPAEVIKQLQALLGVPEVTLTEEENHMLSSIRMLNSKQRRRLTAIIDMMVDGDD